ncbi:glycoside hydrolase [Paenibacillus sp. Soil766]|uniref:glycoside hydrolase family 43 protein n=1 Tax=Paenibacillus sp. Soil766 TaxID=1736404 RepID=UPI00070D2BE3|nr:glycoside hydrolase 43 family protein [Paenibacillus sp. Soil766]KRF03612.1 glycoside hydrolase [Paenibacillus sp. Soil766]
MNNTDNSTLKLEPWVSDQGDGTFFNPVLYADYSDPDVICVGQDFYMTASSFGHIPGLPILHSKDLINWRLINHVIKRMDLPDYELPQHGKGVWAPSIRYHDGKYWVFYGDPDVGIFMSTTDDPAGEWSTPHLVQAGKGLIDTCPFWDDDGQAYLVHAFAGSRAGIKHKLRICRMSPDGKRLLDEGTIVYDNPDKHPTLEGPKMYKRNGTYYIFAPAGGVETGWQTVFRSKNVFGPYEERVVLHQGNTSVNGPHQGGWVELESGESWFMHFQDRDAYGRIMHLQPVEWVEDWPLMGKDINKDGIGEPGLQWNKPDVGKQFPIEVPVSSDEFDKSQLGLQWQWQANPLQRWYSLEERPGSLRLFAEALPAGTPSLYHAPHLLLQKFPAPAFVATVKLDASGLKSGERAGLIVFGYQYMYIGIHRTVYSDSAGDWFELVAMTGDANGERQLWTKQINTYSLYLQVLVEDGGYCSFKYSDDGDEFQLMDTPRVQASKGHWVGAKCGLFAARLDNGKSKGYIDAEWFRVSSYPE